MVAAGGIFLGSSYDILLQDKPVGRVDVTSQGLYYLFTCTCKLPEKGFYRLKVQCGTKVEPLGLLIPKGDEFCLKKRVSIKTVGEGKLEFHLTADGCGEEERFIPVYPHEPFRYISQLKDAYLRKKGDQLGLVIKDRSQVQQDSGRSQKSPDRSEPL